VEDHALLGILAVVVVPIDDGAGLAGRELQIGETVVVQVVKKDQRCIMISLDPETAVSSPQVLARVFQNHEGCAGVYGAVLREGIVKVGDPIYLI